MEAFVWKIRVKDALQLSQERGVLKVTGEGKWLLIMSRSRPYKSEVKFHG